MLQSDLMQQRSLHIAGGCLLLWRSCSASFVGAIPSMSGCVPHGILTSVAFVLRTNTGSNLHAHVEDLRQHCVTEQPVCGCHWRPSCVNLRFETMAL
jgi:hypothetical protein